MDPTLPAGPALVSDRRDAERVTIEAVLLRASETLNLVNSTATVLAALGGLGGFGGFVLGLLSYRNERKRDRNQGKHRILRRRKPPETPDPNETIEPLEAIATEPLEPPPVLEPPSTEEPDNESD